MKQIQKIHGRARYVSAGMVLLGAFAIALLLLSDKILAEDCKSTTGGICVRQADMDIKLCESFAGVLIDSCFSEDRTQYRFQCHVSNRDGKISIMYFTEAMDEAAVKTKCGNLKGRLTELKTFVSHKPNMKRGMTLYMEKGCATCHGAKGQGDGPVGAALAPLPTDFTKGFLYGDDLESIIRIISQGVPNTGMVPYSGMLADYEIADIARFVRTFYKK